MGIQLKSTKEFFIIESDGEEEEEEFIDMEILSSPCCYYNSKKEFEFQLMPTLNEQHNKASADELFYKGKLLPLINNNNNIGEFVEAPFSSSSTNTPNISPPESCRVSCELFDRDHEAAVPVSKRSSSWSTKLKHSFLGKKLIKASRSYLKSFLLFPHSHSNSKSKARESESVIGFRKSFSGVVQTHNMCCSSSSVASTFGGSGSGTHSTSSSSSSSSSFSLNSSNSLFYDLQCLTRLSSSSFELETPIDGAIAHCKQSCSHHFFTASTSSSILLVSSN